MAQVTLTVNQRDYMVACGDGEEEHLTSLASLIDGHVQGLVKQIGQRGQSEMMLMAALVLADELYELKRELGESEAGLHLDQGDAERLSQLTDRIEKIAQSINNP